MNVITIRNPVCKVFTKQREVKCHDSFLLQLAPILEFVKKAVIVANSK
jgi:hypothetical protein